MTEATTTLTRAVWERWRKGESLQQIAQLFDRNHSLIQRILPQLHRFGPGGVPGVFCQKP